MRSADTAPCAWRTVMQVGAAEGVTAQLEEVAAQLAGYKTKLAAAQEEVGKNEQPGCTACL